MLHEPKRTFLLFLFGTISIVAGGVVWHYAERPYHFKVVTPGVLYRSGALRPENLRRVIDRYHIKTLVNVSTKREKKKPEWYFQDEKRICSALKIKHVEMPIKDDTPPDVQQLAQWFDLLDHQKNLPILVHCDHGFVRTGMLVAAYRVERLGEDPATVLKDLPRFGHSTEGPRRKAMREFILGLHPHKVEPTPMSSGD